MISEFVAPGHFYSAIPSITKDYNKNEPKFLNLDFNEKRHIEILNDISGYLTGFDGAFGVTNDSSLYHNIYRRQEDFKYSLMNSGFEWMDARVLYYFLQKNKPKRVIEIGSGNSTLLMHSTNIMLGLNIEIICIEPYPSSYLRRMHAAGHIRLIEDKLENIGLDLFKTLNANDILFIDSSHVGKLDSDVLYYFTKILPELTENVLVHIHDIFFPHDYPIDWLRKGMFWNEQYFLYVFLQYNTRFKIEICNSYAGFKYKNQLKEIQKDSYEVKNNMCKDVYTGGSIWLRVIG